MLLAVTSSHLLELVGSLASKHSLGPPSTHQFTNSRAGEVTGVETWGWETEVRDPLVTATHVPSATTGGDNTLPRVRQWQRVGDTAA